MSRNSATKLDRERLAVLMAVQETLKYGARNKDGSEEVRRKTEGQRDGKTLYRAGSEEEQDGRRNDGRNVSIHDRHPGMTESLLNG